MIIKKLPIENSLRIETEPVIDNRGEFTRLFCSLELKKYLNNKNIVQINYSQNKYRGTIRGLHFQHRPNQEIKLISCIKGRVFDVIVDLRKDSSTFLKWHAEELSEFDQKIILIPEGCAHGFQVIDDYSDLIYFHSEYYNPEYEDGVQYNDPTININWPIEPEYLSERDKSYPYLGNDFIGY